MSETIPARFTGDLAGMSARTSRLDRASELRVRRSETRFPDGLVSGVTRDLGLSDPVQFPFDPQQELFGWVDPQQALFGSALSLAQDRVLALSLLQDMVPADAFRGRSRPRAFIVRAPASRHSGQIERFFIDAALPERTL